MLKFFNSSTAYPTVDHSPFVETFTSLSFTNIFSCFFCNPQLHLFNLAGFSSPLCHTHVFRYHLYAKISQIWVSKSDLSPEIRICIINNLLNVSTQLYSHFNMSQQQSSSFSHVQLSKSNHYLPKSLSQNPGHHLCFHTSHTKSQFFILKISGIQSLSSFYIGPHSSLRHHHLWHRPSNCFSKWPPALEKVSKMTLKWTISSYHSRALNSCS